MYCRFILPKWAAEANPEKPTTIEGDYSDEEIAKYNKEAYNVYYWPNYPSDYPTSGHVNGSHVDTFTCVFVDCDLKAKDYASKDDFLAEISKLDIPPSAVVDSGNGIHVYWTVSDLDAKSFLRLNRRLCRALHTDEAVSTLNQLMRLPGTLNTKAQNAPVSCEVLHTDDVTYTCEELDKLLPPITAADETYCTEHYNRTHGIDQDKIQVSDELPSKFGKLLRENAEAKELWAGNTSDRSKNDYRLGHIMFAHGFTRDEAASVLVNSGKALQRAPIHRKNYALNIIEKIWAFESNGKTAILSPTVREILSKGSDTAKGTRFPCHKLIDDTEHGFRLGQVLGIVGGSGVGKTTLTLNLFLWFATFNPDYHHFFFSLEQPPGELANRIKTICGENDSLYDRIHIISNYNDDGAYNNFSMAMVEAHLLSFQQSTGLKVGATVIDHIGVLDKSIKHGEGEGLIGICKQMKATAVKCNTMLIMLSQAPREKAGIGDLELNKDAAYGTVMFESFCDFLITMWQPLKRAYSQGAPTLMAFKFAKIRHKRQGIDKIQEDVCYQLYFSPTTERLRELTQDEDTAAKFYLNIATNLRKLDRKTDLVPYESRKVDTTEVKKNEPAQPDSRRHH